MKSAGKSRLFRFSMRTVLLLLSALCVWLGIQVNHARQQKQMIDWVRTHNGTLEYEHEYQWASSKDPSQASYEDYAPGWKWLRERVGEEYFVHVRNIRINPHDDWLDDISALSSARHLKDLTLFRTRFKDVAPLSGCAHLEELSLIETQVNDLSGLQSLANLQSINICYAEELEDISSVGAVFNLRHLRLMRTQVGDLSPLRKLRRLESIRLQWTPVSDLSSLSEMHTLEEVSLEYTDVQDISPLMKLTRLKRLFLREPQVSDADVEKFRAAVPSCRVVLSRQK